MTVAQPVEPATRQTPADRALREGHPRRCSAKLSDGSRRCRRYAIAGGTTCPTHGGRAPQVQRAARERLNDLVEPAIAALSKALGRIERQDGIELHPSTVRYVLAVLDRCGYPPASKIELQAIEAKLTEEHVAAMVAIVRRACALLGLDLRADGVRGAVAAAMKEWAAKQRGEDPPEPARPARPAPAASAPGPEAGLTPPSDPGAHPGPPTASPAAAEPEPEVMEL